MTEQETGVSFVVLDGNAKTDEDIDATVDIIRHSLRTQFAGKTVVISIGLQPELDSNMFKMEMMNSPQ